MEPLPTIEVPPSADTKLPSLHDSVAVERFRKMHRIDPEQIRLLRYGLYQMHEKFERALERLRPEYRTLVQEAFDLQPLGMLERHDSAMDGSSKLVLQTADGELIETVLLRARSARTTVCVSTQVGCQAGCSFCATARMGLQRNLSAVEIIEQVLLAARIAREEGRRLRNLVFMGMGEPLHNEEQLHQSIAFLTRTDAWNYPNRRLMISTVGVPDAMMRLVDKFPGIQLALSLHAARPELRAKLVPISRQTDWNELRATVREIAARPFHHRHQGPVMIEYIMIDGINDTDEDADAIIEYLGEAFVMMNLIPYNPIPYAANWKPTPRERRNEFANRLRAAGIFTTIRYSMGSDVQAACGQLVQNGLRTASPRVEKSLSKGS